MRIRSGGRRLYARVVVLRTSVGDIVLERVVKQNHILSHKSYLLPEAAKTHLSDINAVDQNSARRRIVESHEKIRERCLSRSGQAHKRDDLSSIHG